VARVVLVPGFTQSASAWSVVAAALRAAGHDPVALDVPVDLAFAATAHALGAAGGSGVYAGYSMGGRICLRLALDRPDLADGLVLVSASPGLADAGNRATRRASDEALARDVETRGVEPFLRDWLAQPLFAGLAADDEIAQRIGSHTAAELAAMLRNLGTGTQEPLWNRLGELAMPVALVSGRADTKFDAINDEMQAACDAMQAACDATRIRLDGGHALPLEQPHALAAAIAEWLAR
jgi:2-succinyl-6-hydroxy-2,4-cyclohexadiene-1-carboxylate synthase